MRLVHPGNSYTILQKYAVKLHYLCGPDMEQYGYKEIWKVSYPILISLVMEQLIGMTDTVFLGRVGELELGASAVAGVYYMVLYMLGFGFSIGAQIMIGHSNGEKDYRKAGKLFWHALYFLLALSAMLCILSEFLSPVVLGAMLSSEDITLQADSYLRWRAPGLILAFCVCAYRAFYVGSTHTRILSTSSVVMVISNIAFNWALIFGKLGLEPMGIRGAALGSTLAEGVSLLYLIIASSVRVESKEYGLHTPSRFDMGLLGSILKVSLWTMIQSFFSIFTWLLFFIFIEHTGQKAIAASNILRSTSGLIWMVLSAFASTGCSLISNLLGQGRKDSVRPLIGRVLKLSYIVLIPVLVFFCLCPKLILGLYTDMQDIIQASIPGLWVLSVSYLLTIPSHILFQAVAGTGETRAAFFLEMGALVVYTVYCTVVIAVLHSGLAASWASEAVYAAAMTLLCSLFLRKRGFI